VIGGLVCFSVYVISCSAWACCPTSCYFGLLIKVSGTRCRTMVVYCTQSARLFNY
jgi:hypothetical protein